MALAKDLAIVGAVVVALALVAKRADVRGQAIIRDLEADDLARLERMHAQRAPVASELVELERLWELSSSGPEGDPGFDRGAA
jgi:hypothetical protein